MHLFTLLYAPKPHPQCSVQSWLPTFSRPRRPTFRCASCASGCTHCAHNSAPHSGAKKPEEKSQRPRRFPYVPLNFTFHRRFRSLCAVPARRRRAPRYEERDRPDVAVRLQAPRRWYVHIAWSHGALSTARPRRLIAPNLRITCASAQCLPNAHRRSSLSLPLLSQVCT